MVQQGQIEDYLFPDYVSDRDADQVVGANASGLRPVLFIHGLWLHEDIWTRWAERFAKEGLSPLTPRWPSEPQDIEEARRSPESLAGTSLSDVVNYITSLIEALAHPPVIVGHSMGGLIAQILAARGLASATVAIAPTPFRHMSALFWGSEDIVWPILRNPAHRSHAFALSKTQFKNRFANMLDETAADELFGRFVMPAPARPLFDTLLSNFYLWKGISVLNDSAERAPMLLIAGEADRIVPLATVEQAHHLQESNPCETELLVIPDAGHSLVIDHNWQQVADATLGFLAQFGKHPSSSSVVD